MRPLPRPLQALVTWTAILPLVLGVSALVAPLTAGWPDPLRTALVITVVVPLAVFWVVPLLARTAQRMRGAPASVVAASCPAPGVRSVVTEAACASGGAGSHAVGAGVGGAGVSSAGIGGAAVSGAGPAAGPAGAGLAPEPGR